jgi:hypothetical protein
MKFIIVLILLVVVGGLALYYGGGYSSFDPTKQGEEARAAIQKRMSQGVTTWTQVCKVGGDPLNYRLMNRRTRTVDGVEQVYYKPGAPNKFDADILTTRINEGNVEGGFILEYQFSAQVAFTVQFDEYGNALSVTDKTTIKDLLQM